MLEPLRHLGALAFFLFWLLAASGLYLYLRFDTSLGGAYDSIGELEWWFGGVLRSVHRYAADALVVVTAAHLLRELWKGRFRGFRAFSWISGVPLVWLVYASGIVGYWLVWDARAQYSAIATAEWAQAAAIGAEPMARNFLGAAQLPDRVFSLFVFLHIGLPLALLAGMWIHVQRLGQPKTVARRTLALGLAGALAALAALRPAASAARWDPARAGDDLPLDWLYQFVHPLMYATSAQTVWILAIAATIGLALFPYIGRRQRLLPARVDEENCNGCGRCVADCPYNAIDLKDKASVMAERCAACGICAGACPSSTPFRGSARLASGIDLPDLTIHALRQRTQALLQARAERIVFRCERSRTPASEEAIELRCLGMLPPAFVEYALRNGAREVRAAGCAPECAYRLGMELSAARFAGRRDPDLRANVRPLQANEHEYSFTLR